MTTSIKVDVASLLAAAGERKHYNALVTMGAIRRGEEEIEFAGAVEVDIAIEAVKRGVLYVEGDVSGVLKLVCSRCLEDFTAAYGAPISETFCVPMRKCDEECYIIEGREMDLGPAVEQAFLLALPMKIVHDEDCRGLCSICGTNLNSNPNHSHDVAPDTRFGELGRLLGGDWEERDTGEGTGRD
jgi:uncharacterized protein